jgi:hypothetical protein
VFEFACGIEKTLADRLALLGVTVSGRRLESSELSLQESHCDSANNYSTPTYASKSCTAVSSSVIDCSHSDEKLNLDVTAMLAYVSGLTNGRCNFKFKEPVLNQQAEWETARPVKPVLDQLFQGVIC